MGDNGETNGEINTQGLQAAPSLQNSLNASNINNHLDTKARASTPPPGTSIFSSSVPTQSTPAGLGISGSVGDGAGGLGTQLSFYPATAATASQSQSIPMGTGTPHLSSHSQTIQPTPLASPETPAPPPSKKSMTAGASTKPAPRIYSAVYSGVGVYEAMIRGIAVMRRRADGYMNATQILKVAGVDKGRRTKILEKEILAGLHEKIQGGYGKYQGTWIPFERGRELAVAHNCDHILAPIFDFNPSAITSAGGRTAKSPNKRGRPQNEALVGRSGGGGGPSQGNAHMHPNAQAGQAYAQASGQGHFSPGLQVHHNSLVNLHNARTSGIYVGGTDDPNDDGLGRKEKLPGSTNTSNSVSHAKKPYQPPQGTSAHILTRTQHSLTALFQNASGSDTMPDSIAILDTTNGALHPDLAIDELGHTALHWAASLGRIANVHHLLTKGADAARGNIAGESALERSVLVNDNYDKKTFTQLLQALGHSIRVIDKTGRSILHHIALISAVAGRAPSARYYMEHLLEYIAKYENGDFKSIVDLQDEHGDTALNISARVGNRHLVKMLVDAGANKTVVNKLGLKASDFGVEDEVSFEMDNYVDISLNIDSLQSLNAVSADEVLANLQPPPPINVDSSASVLERLQGVIGGLTNQFNEETADKNKLLFEIQADLKQHSHELADVRKEIRYWENKATQMAELDQKIKNVTEAIESEGVGVWSLLNKDDDKRGGEAMQGVESTTKANEIDIPQDDTQESLIQLRKLHKWMEGTQQLTEQRVASIDGQSASKEVKYKSIVSVCTGVPLPEVEGMLAQLLEAMESDANADLNKVNEFLAMEA
ncbi:hypothetical protein E3P99_01696 [Wallemia hederae]|uniref:HTH APSES-type domain-containing protein n=1 Tax=Wallemia hederae TaxID=1540922 RepID=A0A4V4LTN2_9BASI|nr:hypothetical protein E3P99_01696 [Wallemia hederae]